MKVAEPETSQLALGTARLALEPWSHRHRPAWRKICLDPEVMRYIGSGEIWDQLQADDVFDRAPAHWAQHGFGCRSALDRSSGEWLGFVGLSYRTRAPSR